MMNWTNEDLQDARDLDRFDHGTLATCHLNNAVTVGEVAATPETAEAYSNQINAWRAARRKMIREINRRVPLADRVSLRGFRVGDRVTMRGIEGEYRVCHVGVPDHLTGKPSEVVNVSDSRNKSGHWYANGFSDWHLDLIEARQCKYDQRTEVSQ